MPRVARRLLMPAALLACAFLPSAGSDKPPALTVCPDNAAVSMGEAPSLHVYKIGRGDILDISVWNNEAVSRVVPVRPDGQITLPLLNDVRAAGMTPEALRDDLAQRLKQFITAPEVSVIVREVHSMKVSVVGEVNKPGWFSFGAGATVLDMLALAEGFNEFASPSKIVVVRSNGACVHRLPFNFTKVTSGRNQPNFPVHPGDIIVVP